MFTADTLPAGRFSASGSYDRVNRDPGHITATTLDLAAAVGLTNRLEFGVSFQADRRILVGLPDPLSFGQQLLGLFGDKTPGSPPLGFELMSGSSLAPQLRSPPTPAGALTGAAGYYNLLPFAGLVRAGSAAGSVEAGMKLNLLSQTKGAPLGIAVRGHFNVPVHKAVSYLLSHPVGTADLQFGFDGIVSKAVGDIAELHWNVGYRHINQPAHVSILRLANELPLGFGLTAPRAGRLQFIAESTAEIFFGPHTPNTTFGPESPVDLAVGFGAQATPSWRLSAGYRRPLNQHGGDKNGFVIAVSYTR